MENSTDTVITMQSLNSGISFAHQVAFLSTLTVVALVSTWSVFFLA